MDLPLVSGEYDTMKSLIIPLVALALLALAASSGSRANAAPPAKKKILLVTHTTGFRHKDSIAVGEKIVPDLGEKTGLFTVEFCRDQDDVTKMLTPAWLTE